MKNIIKIVYVLFILGLLILALNAVAWAPEKVTICHANGHGGFETIVVSPNAISGHFDNNGTPNQGHEDDLLYEGEHECPGDDGHHGGHDDDCDLPTAITGFKVQSAVPNDGQNELVWDEESTTATSVNIRFGVENGVWTESGTSTNDGFEAITGLTNGIGHWFQLQPVNDCGVGEWGESIDPLP